ncbi:hypothetical protein JHK85_026145 [Glycine max]|nr:hypothetical protein JHK85_026145 [Glycine max]
MLPQPPSSILASSMAGHDCGSPPLENLSTCYLSKQRTPQLEAPVSDCGVCSRRWVFSLKDFSNCMDKVLVVSYNILGVENASNHPDLYSNIPHSFLEWDRRKRLILEEINNYNASILCFQEVDHFNDLDDLFQNSGFKGVYKANHDKKESDACNLTTMTPSTGKRRFVVGNIHVLFNPNRGDIKLGQVRLLLDKAYKLSQEWGNIPVIIAGDLNSVPQLDIQLHDRRNMSGQLEIQTNRVFRSQIGDDARWSVEELRLASGAEGVTRLQHQLKLCSAYSGVPGNHRTRDDIGEPLATSYHSKFMGTVDYIWHSEDLIPVRVLETLPIDTLRRSRGLPSEKWGSDHLAVVCEFAFANNANVS